MKLWQRLVLLTLIPLVLQFFLLHQMKAAQVELDQAYAEERRQKDLMILLGSAVKSALDTITDMADYMSTKSPKKRQHARQHLEMLNRACRQLTSEGGKEAHVQELLSVIGELAEKAQAVTEPAQDTVNLRDVANFVQFSKLGRRIFSVMDHAQIKQEFNYKQMLVVVQAKRKRFDEMAQYYALLCTGISFAFAAYIIYVTTRQLNVLKKNSENLARGEALLPAMQGTDELSDVDRTFHLMARSINKLNERERAILKNSGEWIFAIDAKLRFSFVSDAVFKLLGFSSEELLGQHGAKLLGKSMESIEKARSGGEDQSFDAILNNKNDLPVELQISVHWSDGEQTFFCIAHDVGARKELERMKQSFMAMVSHDLRTPVSANLLTLDLLKSDPAVGQLTDRGVTLVDRSIVSNNRLMFLVNDLLEMERLDSGQLTLDMELVTFNDLVDETLPAVEMLANAKDIHIERDDSDQFLYCESSRIVQVLVNLVGNAIKFSERGKSVFLKYAEEDGFNKIIVQDQGPGIDQESLPHIFDRFKQVKEDSGAHKQGFGLGLEICKKLVELHGGVISVASETGQGTSFEIRLPKKSI